MIKITAMLMAEQRNYVNPTAKIRQLVKTGELVPIVRGLYETNRSIPGYFLAPIIYGPSYLSFEFVLAYLFCILRTGMDSRLHLLKKPFAMYSIPFPHSRAEASWNDFFLKI